MSNEAMTVGELREILEGLKDTDKIYLPGGLSFYRLNMVADDEFYIEPNEPQAYLSDTFKKKNPQIKVAYIKIDDIEFDESGIVGEPINVELV